MTERPSVHEEVFGVPAAEATTAFAQVSQERVVDGLWGRPGLSRRDRRLLTLTVLAAGANDAALDVHLDGALRSRDLTAAELEEVAVHLAHYAGWPVGSRLVAAIGQAVERARADSAITAAVGVVGVGALGGDVATTLVATGATVLVHDVRPEVAAAIAGATAVADLATLADACAIISIIVRDGPQVLEVVASLAGSARPGTVILVHSTVDLPTIVEAEGNAREAGLALLDVGLCRPSGLDSGFVALVGGNEQTVATAKPVLDAIASHVHHLGPLGSGMIVKALRNAVLYGAYAGISEAVDVCRAAAIDVDALLASLRTSGASGSAGLAFIEYRNDWTAGDGADLDTRHGFVDLARKDLRVAVDAAAALGIDAPFALAVADAMPAAYLTSPDQP